ncbi:DUF1206 domain-containing protein [Neomicrococcus lactis]|uniref:DUF1206 domain-containing protein n=1 Tax=Neomicrococcus lactis TaxID=732241 RepID=UPI002300BFCD|nr:DUF1206 domain-containing protein [Neomicrococcus lactis]
MSNLDRAKQHTERAVNAAERASNHPWFERLARVGFVANGILHLLIGALAWSLAFGGDENADQSGAISLLKQQAYGPVLLWTCLIGCAFMALWHISSAFFGRGGVDGLRDVSTDDLKEAARETKADLTGAKDQSTVKTLGRILKNVGTGLVFGGIAVVFAQFIFGKGSNSQESAQNTTATINSLPGGPILLIIGGIIFVIVGGYFVFKGVSRRFEKDLNLPQSGALRTATKALGTVGYVAKGLTLAAVGLLIIVAAAQDDPHESTGFDGALKAIRDQSFGVPALAFIGAGLIAYGIYLFFRARLADMDS